MQNHGPPGEVLSGSWTIFGAAGMTARENVGAMDDQPKEIESFEKWWRDNDRDLQKEGREQRTMLGQWIQCLWAMGSLQRDIRWSNIFGYTVELLWFSGQKDTENASYNAFWLRCEKSLWITNVIGIFLCPKSWVVSVQCPLSRGFDLMLPSFLPSVSQNGIRSCFNKDAANAMMAPAFCKQD